MWNNVAAVEVLVQIITYPKTVALFLSKITDYSVEVKHRTDSVVAYIVMELIRVSLI